jgi:hypothetical protein
VNRDRKSGFPRRKINFKKKKKKEKKSMCCPV